MVGMFSSRLHPIHSKSPTLAESFSTGNESLLRYVRATETNLQGSRVIKLERNNQFLESAGVPSQANQTQRETSRSQSARGRARVRGVRLQRSKPHGPRLKARQSRWWMRVQCQCCLRREMSGRPQPPMVIDDGGAI
jgi:hypothetical protein